MSSAARKDTSGEGSELDPTPLLKLGFAFAASRTLLSAVELDLFSTLSTPLTSEQLRTALSLHPRGFPDFPDALVALGALNRDGEGETARYSNTPESARFLSRSSPHYLGGMLEMCADWKYDMWGRLTAGLRTGKPQNEVAGPGGLTSAGSWEQFFGKEEKLQGFMDAMRANGARSHRAFARNFDFEGVRRLVDLGGASAQLCCEVALLHEGVQCVSVDLPAVAKIAKSNVAREGMAGRVDVVSGDIWEDSFGEGADVIVMSVILHDYSLEGKKKLLKKAFTALPDGGRLVVIEALIDDARKKSFSGLLTSLNMMIGTSGGFNFSPKEFGVWACEAGFRRCEFLRLADPVHAIVAHK